MNYVSVEPYRTNVVIEPYETYVNLELIRVKSDFTFTSPYQMVDNPKERGVNDKNQKE